MTFRIFLFGIVICLKITISGSFSPDAVQPRTQVKFGLSCPDVLGVMDDSPFLLMVLVRGRSKDRGTTSMFMISSSPMEYSSFFLCMNSQKFVIFSSWSGGSCWVVRALMESSFRLINLRHHDGPPVKSAQSKHPGRLLSVCVHPVFKSVVKFRPSAFIWMFLSFWLSASCCRLQRLIIDSLMPKVRAAALLPSFTAWSIAFNLKAASNALLHLFSIMRVCAWTLPWRSVSLSYWPSCSLGLFCSRNPAQTICLVV